jgi:hypothetical protein
MTTAFHVHSVAEHAQYLESRKSANALAVLINKPKSVLNSAMSESAVFRDRVHRLHQGILYNLNTTRFRGSRVNVTAFTPVRKMWPSVRGFSRNSLSARNNDVQINNTKFHRNRKIRVQSTYAHALAAGSKV